MKILGTKKIKIITLKLKLFSLCKGLSIRFFVHLGAEKHSLFRCVHVRLKRPLGVDGILHLQRAQLDLVEAKLKARAHLGDLHLAALHRLVDVMAKGDVVVLISEGDHPLALLLRYGEEVLENVGHPSAQLGVQIVEHEVRICLRHGPHIGNVVSHDGVEHLKVGRRAEGQVADDEAVRFTAGLVEDDKVGDVVCSTALYQLFYLVVSAVDAL